MSEETKEAVVEQEAAPIVEEQAPLTVVLGEEEPEEQPAPGWVKDVRKRNRELERELKAAKQKLNESVAPKEVDLGPKPTLEKSDYDTEKFETELSKWMEKKRVHDEKQSKVEKEAKTAEEQWKAKLEAYQNTKSEMMLPDYEDAEAVVSEALDQIQQGIIVKGAKNSALLMYALGKNEAEVKKLAAIKDPIEFAFAVAKLEERMKVEGKRPATAPEGKISGTQSTSGSVDSALERLRDEARKTGDYTKVIAYKRNKK